MVVPALFLLAACGATVDNVQSPARLLYLEGQHLEDQGLFTEAAEKFEKLVSQHPGTRLGGHGYLRLAELYSRQQEWIKAETNYRMFLAANSGSPLSSYVLYRLLRVNHEQSYTGLFFPEREIDRDMEPNRKIMLEYRRFYLLHPQSLYLPEAVTIFRAAEDTLARHEVIVADSISGAACTTRRPAATCMRCATTPIMWMSATRWAASSPPTARTSSWTWPTKCSASMTSASAPRRRPRRADRPLPLRRLPRRTPR